MIVIWFVPLFLHQFPIDMIREWYMHGHILHIYSTCNCIDNPKIHKHIYIYIYICIIIYVHILIGYLWSFLCNVGNSRDFHGFFLQTPCPCSNLLVAAALSARSADGLMRSSGTRPKPFMLPFNLSWRPDVQTFHASPGHPGYQGS